MKFNLVLSLTIISLILLGIEARSFQEDDQQHVNKRFLGSIGDWIKDNVLNPIKDNVIDPIKDVVIDPVINGINQGINGIQSVVHKIKDPFIEFGNILQGASNKVVDAVNVAIDGIKNGTLTAINMISNLIFPEPDHGGQSVDPCHSTCYQRIQFQDKNTDYFFDKPNGCISKGFLADQLKQFDQCCDEHNQCLNARCCTNDCQTFKNECDQAYNNCLNAKCSPHEKGSTEYYVCLGRGNFLTSAAINRTCSTSIDTNRKLCYC